MYFPAAENDIQSFRKALLDWYRLHRRNLPWRSSNDPYAIWISEVMLQQTRVDTVIPYYLSFMERYPDIKSLADAEPEALLKSWEGLGYYKRLQNLQKCARLLVAKGETGLPEEFSALRQLPGIGDYIAAALASIAFGRPAAVVDGNVKRVLARLFCDPFPVNHSKAHSHYQPYADSLLCREYPGDANQALMELGATLCSPGNPDCGACPVAFLCEARIRKETRLYPQREKKKPLPFFSIACAAILDENFRVLVSKRPETGMLPGFWEFPGGKCEEGETEERACIREVREETGLTIENPERLCTIRHAYTHFRISLTLFTASIRDGKKHLTLPGEYRWLSLEEMEELAFPAANRKCMPALRKWLDTHTP